MVADEAAVKVVAVSKISCVSEISRFGAAGGHYGAAVIKSWQPSSPKLVLCVLAKANTYQPPQ
jgi:hypothetical protein